MVCYNLLLRKLRKRKMSFNKFCRVMNFPPDIEDILRSSLPLPPSVLGDICVFFNCSLGEIMEYVPDDEKRIYHKMQ